MAEDSSTTAAPQDAVTPSHSKYSKPCDLCNNPKDVLVRCQIDKDGRWHFVCTGKCWREVSGGAIDGTPDHPYYRYGGMWKNKHDAVSAKKRKPRTKSKSDTIPPWRSGHETDENAATTDEESALRPQKYPHLDKKYTKNDKVVYDDRVWVCRKSHFATSAQGPPDKEISLWKEDAV
ncbi:hypothetical protein EMMF5_002528 [Cystobasidiomycetes sp. EMM_F5]